MKNIIEKLKNKNIKSGFSLLENAFCSHLLPALHRSRMARCSHTDYRNCVAQSSAFSLAETMVVLVIVAILMAAAAPLIAKKMSNDSKRLISVSNDGTTVFVAAGDNQVLNVGSKSKKDLKLKVNGNTEMNGDLKIVNKPESGDAVNMILTADGIKTKSTSGDEKYLFKIDPASRETNIEIAIPDYSKIHTECSDVSGCNAPENGFIYSTNSLRGFEISETVCSGSTSIAETSSMPTIKLQTRQKKTLKKYDFSNTSYNTNKNVVISLPLLVPIKKNNCYKCDNATLNVVSAGLVTLTGDENIANKCYFIPLTKAKSVAINSGS